MHNFRQRSLKASFMHSPITRTHSVGKAVHHSLVTGGWLQSYLYLYTVLLLSNTYNMFEEWCAGTYREITYIIGQTITRIEDTADLFVVNIIPGVQVKSHAAIEVSGGFQATYNGLRGIIGLSVKDGTII